MHGQGAAETCGPPGLLLVTDYQKKNISADEMYSTICVEWAADHFGLSLT